MATPVFACGFECGVSAATSHFTLGASGTFSTTTIRTGARSVRCNPAAATTGNAQSRSFTAAAVWVIRAYIRFASLPTGNTPLLYFNFNSHEGLWFQSSDSKLYPGYIGPVFGSTGFSVTTGVWYRVDLRVDFTNNPRLIDVQVDGTALTQLSEAVAGGTSTGFMCGSENTATMDVFFDDVLVSNTTGDYPLGAGQVDHFVPTADGTHNVAGAADFKKGAAGVDILNSTTDAYLLVDEVPLDDATVDVNDYINLLAPPNATDYVEVKYGPAPGVGTPTTGPRAVEAIVAYAAAGTATRNMELRLNDNGTTNVVFTATAVAGVTTNTYARKHYATAPSTSAAWTSTLFNNLKIRFGSPAAVDAVPDSYFTCTMIEAEFEAVAAAAQVPPDLMHRGQMPALLAQ